MLIVSLQNDGSRVNVIVRRDGCVVRFLETVADLDAMMHEAREADEDVFTSSSIDFPDEYPTASQNVLDICHALRG